jgi:beta-lactam-binding protein with PASTA domain
MAEEKTLLSVEVPYLFNEPVIEAERELKEAGLSWKLTGNVRQGAYVKSQSPFPGAFVPKGTMIDLYCVVGPTP